MSSAGAQQVQDNSVEDDLRSAFEAIKAKDESAAGTGGETPEPAAVDKPQDGRARDESGRFAKDEQPKERKAEDKPQDAAQSAPQEQPAKPAVKAPDGWTAEMKALFGTLDPKVQAEISRRETELTRKITSVDEERTFGRKLKEVASPYMATIIAEGSTVDQAFAQFLNYAHIMRQGTPQQKAAALQNVARTHGVQLNQQPQPNALHPAIETLQQRIDRMEQERQAEINTRQQQESEALQSEIERFSTDPKNVHFETVKAHMGALLQSGLAKDLQDAYDQACHAHPEIRSTLSAAQLAAVEEKRIADQKAKAEAAKKAGGSIAGGPGGARAPANSNGSVGSIDDDIRAAFRSVTGRV